MGKTSATNAGMRRILFLISQTVNRSNGGVTSVSQILTALHWWPRTVFTQRQTDVNDRWIEAGISVKVTQDYLQGNILYRVFLLLALNFKSWKHCRRNRIDLIHANDIKAFLFFALGAKLAGATVVFNIRDTKRPDQSYGFTWMIATRLADHVIALSAEMKDVLQKRLNICPSKMGYIYSVVDLKKFFPYENTERHRMCRTLGVVNDQQSFNIGYVAAFMDKKKQLPLIENALPALFREYKHAKIFFVGDAENSYAKKCKEAVIRLGLENNVVFAGYQSNIHDWYNAFDVTLITSEREGLARCMIESIACGTPVFSFNVTSAKEVLHDFGAGVWIHTNDYTDLIEQLVHFYRSPAKRVEMGKRGVEFARRHFSEEVVLAKYKEVYKRA